MLFVTAQKFQSFKRSLILRAALALLTIVVLRGSTLEILDLVDTTESRYAAVAYDMYSSGDYVTPVIPDGVKHVPYLGKPAGHFWLMALNNGDVTLYEKEYEGCSHYQSL